MKSYAFSNLCCWLLPAFIIQIEAFVCPIVDVNEWFYACLFNEDGNELAKLSRNPSSVISQLKWCKSAWTVMLPIEHKTRHWRTATISLLNEHQEDETFKSSSLKSFPSRNYWLMKNLTALKTKTLTCKLGWEVYGKKKLSSQRGRYFVENLSSRTFSIYSRNSATFKYFYNYENWSGICDDVFLYVFNLIQGGRKMEKLVIIRNLVTNVFKLFFPNFRWNVPEIEAFSAELTSVEISSMKKYKCM